MGRYRKKPVVIEAVRWTGRNKGEVREFFDQQSNWGLEGGVWNIITLEGTMKAGKGDWIIKGVKGEYYPCKPDIFEATYEPVATADE